MIFNNELLFIHVPKTAGMSLSDSLCSSLKGKVFNTLPEGHQKQVSNEILVVL